MTAGFVLFLYVKSYFLWYFFLITIYKPLISFCFMKCEVFPNKWCRGKKTTHQIHKILIAWKNNGKTAAIVFRHTFRSCIKTKSLRHILSVIYIYWHFIYSYWIANRFAFFFLTNRFQKIGSKITVDYILRKCWSKTLPRFL